MQNPAGDQRPKLLAANITTSVIALIALGLRFVSRYTSKQSKFWWDDWLALASAPFLITIIGLNAWWVSLGLGLHVQEALHYGTPSQWKLVLYIENLIYNTGLSLVKLSVVFFYLRVFKNITLYQYVIWFAAFLAVAWVLGNDFLAAFECTPAQAYWKPTPGATCVNNNQGFLATTVSNVVVDVIILVVPLPMLWKLRLSAKKKLAVIGVFLCGYGVVVVAIVRLVSILDLGSDLDSDFTWHFVLAQLMVSIEIPIALFSSCLPAIFYLSRRMWQQSSFGTSRSSKYAGDGDIPMGPLGNPLEYPRKASFVRMHSRGDDNSEVSNVSQSVDRLYPIPLDHSFGEPSPLQDKRPTISNGKVESFQFGT